MRVTVIATGFPPAPLLPREPAIEALAAEDFFAPRDPNAAAAAAAPPAPPAPPVTAAEPEPVLAGASHTFDDELDVPAYLRQGKLLG